MASKATYVFMDVGTTGDIKNIPKLKITELCLVAVRRDRLLGPCYKFTEDTPAVPRVQNKLTLCFHPGENLSYNAKPGGGFTDADLEYEKSYDECFELIDNFLKLLTEPVYLVAHNGFYFDFPILKRHLKGKSFSKDVMCVDTYYGFYDILCPKKSAAAGDDIAQSLAKLSLNNSLSVETPKKKRELRQDNAERVKSPPWGEWRNKPKGKHQYTLTTVYERVMGCKPEDAHKAEMDCQLMLRIAVKLAKEFVAWADEHHSSFAENVEPITPEARKNIKTRTSGVKGEDTGRERGVSDSKTIEDFEPTVSRGKEAGNKTRIHRFKKDTGVDSAVSKSQKVGDAELTRDDSKTPVGKKERRERASRILSSNFKHELDLELASNGKVGDAEPINSITKVADKKVRTPKAIKKDPGVDPIASETKSVGDSEPRELRFLLVEAQRDKKASTPRAKKDPDVDPSAPAIKKLGHAEPMVFKENKLQEPKSNYTRSGL